MLTSSSVRCVQTVEPYANEQVLPLVEVDALAEELYDEEAARALLHDLMTTRGPSVLCSHRPILPRLVRPAGLSEEPLQPAELVVCHHRRGTLVATERHHVLPVVP